MKKLAALLLALCMCFSLVACGNAPAEPAAPAEQGASGEHTEPVTIKISNYAILESGYTEFWESVKTGFEEKFPNVTIEWVTTPYGETVNQVINMAGGGDMVDAVAGELFWIPTFVEAGLAAPVDEMLDADFIADYYPSVLKAHQVDGKTYGIPMGVSPAVMFYNKDIFQAAGLDPENPPKTYEEMLEAAAKIDGMTTEDGNKIFPFGMPTASVPVSGADLTGMIYNFGGNILNENGELANDEGFADAFRMLKTLDEKGYLPENCKAKDLRNLFALGQLAMFYDQSWGFNGIRSINPDAEKFAAVAMPLAGGQGTGESMMQSMCWVLMNNGGERAWATKEFVQYMMNPEIIRNYTLNITPSYPAKKELADCLPDLLKNSTDATTQAKAVPLVPALNDINLEICSLAQAVTVGGQDVDSAIKDFEEAAKAILAN